MLSNSVCLRVVFVPFRASDCVATIRGWRLFEGGVYSRVATIQGGDYSKKYGTLEPLPSTSSEMLHMIWPPVVSETYYQRNLDDCTNSCQTPRCYNLKVWTNVTVFQWLLSWLLHKWWEGYLLRTSAQKITCWSFHWMLQLSLGQRWSSVVMYFLCVMTGLLFSELELVTDTLHFIKCYSIWLSRQLKLPSTNSRKNGHMETTGKLSDPHRLYPLKAYHIAGNFRKG